MNTNANSVVTGIAIPTKAVSLAPRQSIYPVDAIIAAGEGSAFGIELRGENGVLLDDAGLKKLASQKQSQISGLGKTRDAEFTTRLIEDQETASAFNLTAPVLGVWYTGKRKVKAKKVKADEVPAVDAGVPSIGDEAAPEVPSL